jgi:flagellar biosynthesis GTPase FlhF
MAEEAELRLQIETQLRAEAQERERLAEAARMAIEAQQRLEAENARIARQREEEERIEEEKRRREEEERELEALRQAELERIRREDEEAKAKARAAMPEMGDGKYSYTSKSVRLVFRKSVDPNITTRIHEIIKATVEYYGKDRVYLKIRATVPDSQNVILDFLDVPLEEMELLGNIIKILGNSGLGISKAIIE